MIPRDYAGAAAPDMSKRNPDRLKALVARFEDPTAAREDLYLSQEEFENLLSHYYDNFDYDRTLEVADLAIERYVYSPEFYKWKALIHKINMEEEDAFDALEKLALYAPNDEESLVLRLEVLIHFEHREEARSVLERLQNEVTGDQKHSLLAFFDGLLLLQEFRFPESFAALREAVRLDPKQEPALEELLNAPELVPFRKKLRPLFENLLAADPFNDLLWYYNGLWYDDEGDDAAALDAFGNARALRSNPTYDLEYADKLFDLEHFAAALGAYSAYFEHPDAEQSYETNMRVGRSHQLLGDIPAAKRAFFRAIEVNAEPYDVFQHLAECFASEEKWGVAAYNYGRAVEREGHTPECWLGLALCHAATTEFEEADHAFRKAIALDDRYSDAIVAYSIFLIEQGEEQRALTQIATALDEFEDANLLYGAVAVHLMAQRRRTALDLLNTALKEYYDLHELLLEFLPELHDDREVRALLDLYRPR